VIAPNTVSKVVSRRRFMITAVAAGGGLALGVQVPVWSALAQ